MPFLLAVLGCSRGPSVATTPERSVPLCEPWSTWSLPEDEQARIAYCDERRLSILLPAGSADRVAPGWRLAVREAGWSEETDASAPGMIGVRYVQEEVALNLSVIDEVDRTLLVLARIGP